MFVALVVFQRQGQRLGRRASKQQQVRHVFPALARQIDLRHGVVTPAQGLQHLVNHILFGLRLIEGGVCVQPGEDASQCGLEGVKRPWRQTLERWCVPNANMKKVLGEELALHGGVKLFRC